MNKAQLVDALTARIGDRRAAASAVDGLLEIIVETVSSGGSVTLTGFGVFETRARAARVARNPRTGETVPVAATTVPAFRPGTAFKALVSGNSETGTAARPSARHPRPAARASAAAAAVPAAAAADVPAGAARATRSFSAPEAEPVKPAKARKAKAVKEAADKGKGDKASEKGPDKGPDKGQNKGADKGKVAKPAKKVKGRK